MHEAGTKKRTSNLSIKWQIERKPRKRRVCLAQHELQGGSEKLPRASTTQSGFGANLKRSGIAKGKQQPERAGKSTHAQNLQSQSVYYLLSVR